MFGGELYNVRITFKKEIQYNGKEIVTRVVEQINHCVTNTPILGRVVCGDARSEEENIEEYVDLPTSIFGSGDLFVLEAYGDSINLAGIEEGDMVVVKRTTDRPSDGDLVIALCPRLAAQVVDAVALEVIDGIGGLLLVLGHAVGGTVVGNPEGAGAIAGAVGIEDRGDLALDADVGEDGS